MLQGGLLWSKKDYLRMTVIVPCARMYFYQADLLFAYHQSTRLGETRQMRCKLLITLSDFGLEHDMQAQPSY